MSVVQTLPTLYRLNEMSKQLKGANQEEVHQKIVCNPLKKIFPQATSLEVQQELLTRGLFNPSECMALDGTLKILEAKNMWITVQNEFEHLKRLWNGPDVPILIYPLTKNRPIVDGVEVKKNGVSYHNALFLFVSEDLEAVELKALLAHEYHHICRLANLNKAPHEIELLDTLIIEGLAECAVDELYGERGLSPWTKKYTQEVCLKLWTKYFIQAIHMKGVDNHFPFLYGNEAAGLPKWIGYCIGYRIVCSYMENSGVSNRQLLNQTLSSEILKGSVFKVD